MFSLRTDDDWATLSVQVTVAPDPAETFNNAATASSAYEAMVAWVAWLNDAGRAWSGVVSFVWGWARNPADSGALMTLAATGGTFAINGGANTSLGFIASGVVSAATGTTVALGTWAPVSRMAVRNHMRVLERGDASGDGALRPGVPGAAHQTPSVGAIGTAVDAARLAAILADAENPRVAVVYQLHKDAWLTLAVGEIKRSVATSAHYRFDFDTLGEVI